LHHFQHNVSEHTEAIARAGGNCEARTLLWGEGAESPSMAPYLAGAGGVGGAGGAGASTQPFDYVVGADVLYTATAVRPLLTTVDLLCRPLPHPAAAPDGAAAESAPREGHPEPQPSTRFVLVYKSRDKGEGRFFELLAQKGFVASTERVVGDHTCFVFERVGLGRPDV
jgi:hypothetical protein